METYHNENHMQEVAEELLAIEDNRQQLLKELEEASEHQLKEEGDAKVKAFLKGLIDGGTQQVWDFAANARAVPRLVLTKDVIAEQKRKESLTPKKEAGGDEALELADFLAKTVEKMPPSRWKELSICLPLKAEAGLKRSFHGAINTKEEILAAVKTLDPTKYSEEVIVMFDEVNKKVKKPYHLYKLNALFGEVEMDLGKLEEHLKLQLEPLQGYKKNEDEKILEPNLDYVLKEPLHADTYFDGKEAVDKSFAVVVAGESGSGKSVYSCLQAKEKGFLTVYTSIRPTKRKPPQKGVKKQRLDLGVLEQALSERPMTSLERLDSFLRLLIRLFELYGKKNIDDRFSRL